MKYELLVQVSVRIECFAESDEEAMRIAKQDCREELSELSTDFVIEDAVILERNER